MTGICLRRIVITPPLSMFQKSNTLPVILILHRINPDFGAGGAAGRDRQIEAVESFSLPAEVTRRTPAQNSWNLGEQGIVVWITLLKNVDESLASRHVNALMLGTVVQVIRILNAGKGSDHTARGRVKDGKCRRFARGYEEAVMGLLGGHWEIFAPG